MHGLGIDMGAVTSSCCSSVEKGGIETNGQTNVPQKRLTKRASLSTEKFSPELLAWIRGQFGPEIELREAYDDFFKDIKVVDKALFEKTLQARGCEINLTEAFAILDADGDGKLNVSDFETMQQAAEQIEAEGLKHFRDFLKEHFSSPAKAFEALGKGVGEILTEEEFSKNMKALGFTEDTKKTFLLVDKDASGEVSFEEFKAAMKSVKAEKVSSPRQNSIQSSPKNQDEKKKDDEKKSSPRESGAKRNSEAKRASKETTKDGGSKEDLDVVSKDKKPARRNSKGAKL